jgi:hypothetical protein
MKQHSVHKFAQGRVMGEPSSGAMSVMVFSLHWTSLPQNKVVRDKAAWASPSPRCHPGYCSPVHYLSRKKVARSQYLSEGGVVIRSCILIWSQDHRITGSQRSQWRRRGYPLMHTNLITRSQDHRITRSQWRRRGYPLIPNNSTTRSQDHFISIHEWVASCLFYTTQVWIVSNFAWNSNLKGVFLPEDVNGTS